MALRNIVLKDDSILYKKSRDIVKFDSRLHTLIDDMVETMEEANGVGLAAVQVGVLRRVVVINVNDTLYELVNPVIILKSEENQCGAEGCLSFPGEQAIVRRPYRVTVRAQDRNGKVVEHEGEELLARAFCHELDHLEGIVFHEMALSPEEEAVWEEEFIKEEALETARSI